MLRVTERWQHSSYWITSPFSPSNVLITDIFAVIFVFTFCGKMQLFIVCMKQKRPVFPKTVKTKAAPQPHSSQATWSFRNLGPNLLLAQANASPPKHLNCTCLCQWLLWLVADKINTLCSFNTYCSLVTEFKHLVYILPSKEYCSTSAAYSRAGEKQHNCIRVRSNPGPKQGHSLCATFKQTAFTDFHYYEFIILEIAEEHCHYTTNGLILYICSSIIKFMEIC